MASIPISAMDSHIFGSLRAMTAVIDGVNFFQYLSILSASPLLDESAILLKSALGKQWSAHCKSSKFTVLDSLPTSAIAQKNS
jgi:hypothetical protein